jgi:hypothetical protein
MPEIGHWVLGDCVQRARAKGFEVFCAPSLRLINCETCLDQVTQLQKEWLGVIIKNEVKRSKRENAETTVRMWNRAVYDMRRTHQVLADKIQRLQPFLLEAERRELAAQKLGDTPPYTLGESCPKCQAGVMELHEVGSDKWFVCSLDTRCDFKAPFFEHPGKP